MIRKALALVFFALLSSACAAGIDDMDDEVGETTGVNASSLSAGTPGNATNLAVNIRSNQLSCSGTLVQRQSGDTTTSWAITASHCFPTDQSDAPPIDPTIYRVIDAAGRVRTVSRIYRHPVNDWGIGVFGATPTGKVDVALVQFSGTPLALPARMHFGTFLDSTDVVQEGYGPAIQIKFEAGHIDPDPTYSSRVTVNTSGEPGDSGGPLWQSGSGPNWGLEAIFNSAGHATDSSAFQAWAKDVLACGGFDPRYPNADFCTAACPCQADEGDCDPGTCAAGLTCTNATGDLVGLPSHYDVCQPTRGYSKSNTHGYCGSIGGCAIFEGDCTSHDECLGNLVCIKDAGRAIGMNDTVDVCDLPRSAQCPVYNRTQSGSRDSSGGRCTVECPCGIGDGDCDENNHDTCRGILKCQRNVGLLYGFDSASVDVCVHPDVWTP